MTITTRIIATQKGSVIDYMDLPLDTINDRPNYGTNSDQTSPPFPL